MVSNDFTHYGSAFGYTPFPHHRAAEEIRKLDQRGAQLITTAHAQEFYQLAKTTTFDGATSIPLALLCQALQKAGVPLISLEIFERGASDRTVKATFEWGVRYANISMDAPHTALWDILRQIPELRG